MEQTRSSSSKLASRVSNEHVSSSLVAKSALEIWGKGKEEPGGYSNIILNPARKVQGGIQLGRELQ